LKPEEIDLVAGVDLEVMAVGGVEAEQPQALGPRVLACAPVRPHLLVFFGLGSLILLTVLVWTANTQTIVRNTTLYNIEKNSKKLHTILNIEISVLH
jgi:hypothetical protein